MRKYEIEYDTALEKFIVWEKYPNYRVQRYAGTKKNCVSWIKRKNRNARRKQQHKNI